MSFLITPLLTEVHLYFKKLYPVHLIKLFISLMLDLCIVTTPTQPQLNPSLVGVDMKMILHTNSWELNVGNISAVTDQILTKL